ncbi:MAG: NUDIX hydrolase [Deltaproteobacteria bacterium]|nr:NUDIX hydrolase [Deltaproteobacteria bacterium]
MKRKRSFCHYCGGQITREMEEEVLRDFCGACKTFFYENPLPVVSVIMLSDRKILLVKRGRRPYRGKWCLPTGFVESGESIEAAAMRELEEETGIQGRIVNLVDVDSGANAFYGDLIFLCFEAEMSGGSLRAGGDTVAARYFPIEGIPRLAFPANNRAVQTFIRNKSDYWAIADSFSLTAASEDLAGSTKQNLLSDRLVQVIEDNAVPISRIWIEDVTSNHSTPSYHHFDRKRLFLRVHTILSQFGKWLGGGYNDQDIHDYYTDMGGERRREGFRLGETLSALSLIKKHIWEFALSRGMWQKTIDIYMALELDRRIVIFFDKASFYTARGYESPETGPLGQQDLP